MQKVLQLDSRDNVLIALQDLKQGTIVSIDGVQVTLATDVPAKQKFPTKDLAVGDEVTMYGVLVGKVFRPVRRGELLSTANLSHEAAPYKQRSGEYRWSAPDVSRWK
jgi:altronate hydrolase